jgi:hypothetical protein
MREREVNHKYRFITGDLIDKSGMVSGVTNSTKKDAGISQGAVLTRIWKYFEFAQDAQWTFGCCNHLRKLLDYNIHSTL